MKIALAGNQARAMGNFWTVLLRHMLAAGHEVICLVPIGGQEDDPSWEDALTGLGVRLVHYPLARKGLNPFKDFKTFLALRAFFASEKPDVLFAYTIKPVIYAAMAAQAAKYPARPQRHLMITGLGYMFEGGSFIKNMLTKIVRVLYRAAFSVAGTVFFQNKDDYELFEKLSIIPESIKVRECPGTGVDLLRFACKPLPAGPPRFLFVGRLLEAKGLRELAGAARILKKDYPDFVVNLLGPQEKGPGSIPGGEMRAWEDEGLVKLLGETTDVRPFIADASVVVLPSWREGTPCSLMEAMSMGRAVVAADAPGSREVVVDGQNGFLTEVKNPLSLAVALKRFYTDPALAAQMGTAGRALVEKKFDADTVAANLLSYMESGS